MFIAANALELAESFPGHVLVSSSPVIEDLDAFHLNGEKAAVVSKREGAGYSLNFVRAGFHNTIAAGR